MKYQVLVEKHDDAYVARCLAVPHLRVAGRSVNTVLARLQREFLCYVHDTDAELEIMTCLEKQKTAVTGRSLRSPLP